MSSLKRKNRSVDLTNGPKLKKRSRERPVTDVCYKQGQTIAGNRKLITRQVSEHALDERKPEKCKCNTGYKSGTCKCLRLSDM